MRLIIYLAYAVNTCFLLYSLYGLLYPLRVFIESVFQGPLNIQPGILSYTALTVLCVLALAGLKKKRLNFLSCAAFGLALWPNLLFYQLGVFPPYDYPYIRRLH